MSEQNYYPNMQNFASIAQNTPNSAKTGNEPAKNIPTPAKPGNEPMTQNTPAPVKQGNMPMTQNAPAPMKQGNEPMMKTGCIPQETEIKDVRLAHAYVPFQKLCNTFTPMASLKKGTIFPPLVDMYMWDSKGMGDFDDD